MNGLNVLIFIIPLLSVAIGVWLGGRLARPAPRQMRSTQKRLHFTILAASSVILMLAVHTLNWWLIATALVLAASSLLELRRKQTDAEAAANWRYDPGKCGNCGYDLTYSDAPQTCPECGWKVPPLKTGAQRADWPIWWRRWRIDHLDRPRYLLWSLVTIMLMFLAAIVGAMFMGWPYIAIVAAPMLLHFGVNLVRVGSYLQREREAGHAARDAAE